MEKKIGQNFRARAEIFLCGFHVITGVFLGCIGIDLRAQPLRRIGNLKRGTLFGAFEKHMLDIVRNAVVFRRFVDAARVDQHPQRNGIQPRHGLDHQPQSVIIRFYLFHRISSLPDILRYRDRFQTFLFVICQNARQCLERMLLWVHQNQFTPTDVLRRAGKDKAFVVVAPVDGIL